MTNQELIQLARDRAFGLDSSGHKFEGSIMRHLTTRLACVEAERDAAITDVAHDCEHCKHATGNGACKLLPGGDEFSPDYTDGFDRDGNCDHWEWCGAQGEG